MPPEKISKSMTFTHDALSAGQRAALGTLPPTLAIAEDVLACHGTPASDTGYLLEEKHDERLWLASTATVSTRLEHTSAALILCGHSHHQHVASASGERLVVNPGSVGCPRYADNADVPRSEAGSPHARYAVATRRARRWSIELIVLEYDWSPVVQRARANGRQDWADGFLRVE
jgi:diadenosine tetraphosphatase ApaH/serine/threonine PP2A family protein phosphatase